MTNQTSTPDKPITWPASGDSDGLIVPSQVRVHLNGSRQEYPPGTLINPPLGGQNYSTWNTNIATDGATAKAEGQTLVRLLLRIMGNYGGKPTDSYDGSCPAQIDNFNREQHYNEVKMFTDQGIWVCDGIDSNVCQSAMQDDTTKALAIAGGGANDLAWPTVTNADPRWSTFDTRGRNLWTDANLQAFHLERWKFHVRRMCTLPYIYCWEALPEPQPINGNATNFIPYDSSWAPYIAQYLFNLRAALDPIDPYTPILGGGRAAYKYNFLPELISAMQAIDSTGWARRFIFTIDDLSDITRDLGLHRDVAAALVAVRDTAYTGAPNGVPVMVQSSGTRRDDDLSSNGSDGAQASQNPSAGLKSAIFKWRALGIPSIFWQRHQNSTNTSAYSLDITDGAGGYTLKQPEHDIVISQYAITLAALEAAAIAAATADGGLLFYVKPDFSNVWQDSGKTTPVTAVGQPLGYIAPVVGLDATLHFTASGSFPTVAAATATIDARPVITSAGTSDYLVGSAPTLLGSGNFTVIVAATFQSGNNIQTAFHVGKTTVTAQQYPKIQTLASKLSVATFQDDAANNATCTDSLTTAQTIGGPAYVPFTNGYSAVLTAVKNGNAQSFYRNGLLSKTAAVTLGTVTATTMRWLADCGGSTGHPLIGQSSGLYIKPAGVTSSANQQAIERFVGFLLSAPVAV